MGLNLFVLAGFSVVADASTFFRTIFFSIHYEMTIRHTVSHKQRSGHTHTHTLNERVQKMFIFSALLLSCRCLASGYLFFLSTSFYITYNLGHLKMACFDSHVGRLDDDNDANVHWIEEQISFGSMAGLGAACPLSKWHAVILE